nr:MAG TPA: hypothetical protein [Caudoviricetes sp.]
MRPPWKLTPRYIASLCENWQIGAKHRPAWRSSATRWTATTITINNHIKQMT